MVISEIPSVLTLAKRTSVLKGRKGSSIKSKSKGLKSLVTIPSFVIESSATEGFGRRGHRTGFLVKL